ncbi:MAG: hypothetical protein KDI69_04800 [Xanthomonadales bacterium]|nr:hypothetical protein [Xanthomonadales bacterium]
MRHLVTAMFLVVAVIHLLPLAGFLGATRLTALYGVVLDDPNLVILMRHRAVLFGLLGVFLAVAAFRPALQPMAFVGGGVSVVSFLYLVVSVGHYNEHLRRVFIADLVAAACLVVGLLAYLFLQRKAY